MYSSRHTPCADRLFSGTRAVFLPWKECFVGKGERRSKPPKGGQKLPDSDRATVGLRIIGGQLRGRKLEYSGDLRTRPMKDRLREAIFNLIGPAIRGKHALDLFAGTGALGLEAISRGAQRATFIEQHYPTADIIRQNIATLGVEQQTDIVPGNTFIWWKKRGTVLPETPWVVFCSPPYDFYVQRTEEMLEMIAGLVQAAPPDSLVIVEADDRFDFLLLPDPQAWMVRAYPPAVVGIYRKG
jgi:16S rRNA (guanine966-N2)-methyltransferase